MPRTQARSEQIIDDGICREDINTTIAGRALIRKLIAGTNISLSSNGADAGTGDVTVSLVSSPSVTGITAGNISISANTISSTNTNGNIIISPNGTGNVGIGTTSPAVKLTLQQADQIYAQPGVASTWDMAFGIAANTDRISGMDFKNFNSAGQVRLMARNNADNYIAMNAMGTTASASFFGQAGNQLTIFSVGKRFSLGTNDSQPLILGTANTERIRIDASGNVGIGTTAPNYILDIVQSQNEATRLSIKNATSGTAAQTMLQIENNTGNVVQVGLTSSAYTGAGAAAGEGYIQTNTGSMFIRAIGANNYVRIGTNSGEKMRVLDSGRVAINRTDANYTVDVNGDINCNGVFRKGGIAGTSGTLIVFDEDYNRYQLTFSGGLLTELIFL